MRRSLDEHVLLEEEIAFHHHTARLSKLTINAKSSDEKPLVGVAIVRATDRPQPRSSNCNCGIERHRRVEVRIRPAGLLRGVISTRALLAGIYDESVRTRDVSLSTGADGRPAGLVDSVLGIRKYDEKRGAGIRIGDVGMGWGLIHACGT